MKNAHSKSEGFLLPLRPTLVHLVLLKRIGEDLNGKETKTEIEGRGTG